MNGKGAVNKTAPYSNGQTTFESSQQSPKLPSKPLKPIIKNSRTPTAKYPTPEDNLMAYAQIKEQEANDMVLLQSTV